MKHNINKRIYYTAFFIIFISLWLIKLQPIFWGNPGSGLDSSWFIGVCWGLIKGLNFNNDIVFTFGPLGFLYVPELIDVQLYKYSAIFSLCLYTAFIVAIALLVNKIKPLSYTALILSIPFCILIPSVDFLPAVTICLYAYLLVYSRTSFRTLLAWTTLISIFAAFISLIKYTNTITALACLGGFALAYLICSEFPVKRFIALCSVIGTVYVTSLCVFWVLLRQPLDGLPQFMINGYHIAMDYNSGMSWTNYGWTLARALAYNVISILSILYYVYLLVPSINKRRKDTVAFIIITIPVIFFAFKHGFVRNDPAHIISFISVIFTFFLLLNILTIEKGPFNLKWIKSNFTCINLAVFGILMITMAHFAAPTFWQYNIFNNINSYKTAYSIFTNDSTGADIIKSSKARILQDYSSISAIPNMDALKSEADNNTIDIIPWDISLLWAMDANWTPRPVFQSYQAYSKYLDDINRKFYTNMPPQYLLYSYKSIDNRYPLFDEPATLRTIMNNYKYTGNYGEFILLSRQNEKSTNNLILIGTNSVKIGDEIAIPRNRGYTFANIKLQYSWIGHIKEILYKPGEAYIELIKRDGSVSPRYRIIPETLQNGVLISDYIESHSDLNSLLTRSPQNNVQSIKITCSDPADYDSEIAIEYYSNN